MDGKLYKVKIDKQQEHTKWFGLHLTVTINTVSVDLKDQRETTMSQDRGEAKGMEGKYTRRRQRTLGKDCKEGPSVLFWGSSSSQQMT